MDRIEAMVADLVPGGVDAVDFEEAETELWNRSRLAAGKAMVRHPCAYRDVESASKGWRI